MVGDNAPAQPGWKLPPRCCGEWVRELVCPTCGEYTLGKNIELGSE